MQFAENVRKGPAEALMNACRRTESFGNTPSTVVKDFGAFQGSTWYFRHPSSVAALLRTGGRPNLRHFPSQIPLAWGRGNAFYSPYPPWYLCLFEAIEALLSRRYK